MKHLMRYEGFTPQERQDEILDKISKYGIDSLTHLEKDFLNSYAQNGEAEAHKRLNYIENEVIFEDDAGMFKFEYNEMEDYGDEKHYIGILYVPTLDLGNGKKIEGRLEGKIIDYGEGRTSPEFQVVTNINGHEVIYDIFDFCNGIEHELDSFVDYVVAEIENQNTENNI